MSDDRTLRATQFVAEAGWGDAARVPLAGDASHRRYERLYRGADGAVLMDAPPETGEDVAPFLDVTAHLQSCGLSAPRILAADRRHGLLLLEDLGDDLFSAVLRRDPTHEQRLYTVAVATLVQLQSVPAPEWVEDYSLTYMLERAGLAWRWYAGIDPAPLAAAFTPALNRLDRTRDVLALRDYHAENLIWLPQRNGPARVGLLDYQDARRAPPSYDLVSLVTDARRDVSPAAADAAIAHFADLTGVAPDALAEEIAILSAQRNLRILGVFARLSLHFGKASYIDLIPRVWAHLQTALAHPALSDLGAAVARDLPPPTHETLADLKARCGTIPEA